MDLRVCQADKTNDFALLEMLLPRFGRYLWASKGISSIKTHNS